MSKKKSIWGTFRVFMITLFLSAASLGIYSHAADDPGDIWWIHLSCSISERYSGVIVDGEAFHLSCSISESYDFILLVEVE